MILVVDGLCNFCNGWVRFLLKRDRGGKLRFAFAQSQFGARILAEEQENPDDPSTVILLDGDRRYYRSEAILRALTALGGPWSAARALILLPRPVRDHCYDAFARRRYRLFGKRQSCPIPDQADRERFLT